MGDLCDYCYEELGTTHSLRAVGFTEWEGRRAPLVKAWCGECEAGDDIDTAAHFALKRAVDAQRAPNA